MARCGGMEDDVFVGSDAIARGALTEHDLRCDYQALFRGIYRARGEPSLRDRTVAAWLSSKKRGVIAGATPGCAQACDRVQGGVGAQAC